MKSAGSSFSVLYFVLLNSRFLSDAANGIQVGSEKQWRKNNLQAGIQLQTIPTFCSMILRGDQI